MKRKLFLISMVLVVIVGASLFHRTPIGFGVIVPRVFAQAVFKISCPGGSSPIAGFQFRNADDSISQVGCYDGFGNLYIGGAVYLAVVGDGAFKQKACQSNTNPCYIGTNNDAIINGAIATIVQQTILGTPVNGRTLIFPNSGTNIFMLGSAADCAAGTSTPAALSSLIQVPDGIVFKGQGQLVTTLMQNPGTNCNMFVNWFGESQGNWRVSFEDLRIDGNNIYDGTHNDAVFHPSNNNSTNSSGCALYWNAAYRADSDAPSLRLRSVYISGFGGTAKCVSSAALIYGSGFVSANNVRIAFNQFAHGLWLKNSDSTWSELYMVANGGYGALENLVIQCGGDNRFVSGYMGGGDGGSAQVYLQGAQNNKFVGMTDDLACGNDMRFTDSAACGGQSSSNNQVTGGQITRAGGGCATQANAVSFEGGASNNIIDGVVMVGNGGAARPWVEIGTAGNNIVIGNVISGFGNSQPSPRANSGTVYDLAPTAPTVSAGFGTTPSIVNSNSYKSFSVNVGTGGTASSGTVGLPSAPNGWSCEAIDITTPATNLTRESSTTTTTAVFTNYNISGVATAWVASDVLAIQCQPR